MTIIFFIEMTSHNKLAPIVELASTSNGERPLPKFHKEIVAQVLKNVEDYPTIVVSVAGLFRSGKSFLVNLMITFLQHLIKVSDILLSDIQGPFYPN